MQARLGHTSNRPRPDGLCNNAINLSPNLMSHRSKLLNTKFAQAINSFHCPKKHFSEEESKTKSKQTKNVETWIAFYRLVKRKGVRVREERRNELTKPTNLEMPRIWFNEPPATQKTTTTQHVGWNFNHFARTFRGNDFWRCRYDWFDVVCLTHRWNRVNGLASSRLYWQSSTVLSDQLTNFMSRKSDDRELNRKFIQICSFNRQKSSPERLFYHLILYWLLFVILISVLLADFFFPPVWGYF